jgi:hypothetical protein
MRRIRRIAIGVVVGVVLLGWIIPAGIFLYIARTTPAVDKVVPTQLSDMSVSPVPGKKLSYFGYEFEVPWRDLDDAQTQLFERPDSQTVWLGFRSGLKLFVAFRTKPPADEYAILKRTYETTPDQIHYWALCTSRKSRLQTMLLVAKSGFLQGVGLGAASNPAESGIFELQNQSYKGFQYGDPKIRQDQIQIVLYAGDDTRMKIRILQAAYDDPAGVTQPEINRIIQSLHRTSVSGMALATN